MSKPLSPEPDRLVDGLPVPVDAPAAPVAIISVPGGLPDLDAAFVELVGQAPDLAVRLRLPLYLYAAAAQEYRPWPRVSWVVEFREQQLTVAFRSDLDRFIRDWVSEHAV